MYFRRGEMAERSNAAVLKTVDCHRSGGSNPSLSASESKPTNFRGFFVFPDNKSLLYGGRENKKTAAKPLGF